MRLSIKVYQSIVVLFLLCSFVPIINAQDNPELFKKEAGIEHEKEAQKTEEEKEKIAEENPTMTPIERAATIFPYTGPVTTGGNVKVRTEIGKIGVARYGACATIEREPKKEFPIGFSGLLISGTNYQQIPKPALARQSHFVNEYGYGLTTWTGQIDIPLNFNSNARFSTGRFDPWVGIENSSDNIKAAITSGVLCDSDAYPSFHNGFQVTLPIHKQLTTRFFLTSGWNEKVFSKGYDGQASGGVSIRYTPDEKTACGFGWYLGREGVNPNQVRLTKKIDGRMIPQPFGLFGGIELLNPGYTLVNLFNGYATRKFSDKLTVALDTLYATANSPNRGAWSGAGLYATYDASKKLRFGLRTDYLYDPDGLVLVVAETPGTNCVIPGVNPRSSYRGSVSAMAQYKLTDKSKIELEVKYNYSNREIFNVGATWLGQSLIRPTQWVLTFQQVYSL